MLLGSRTGRIKLNIISGEEKKGVETTYLCKKALTSFKSLTTISSPFGLLFRNGLKSEACVAFFLNLNPPTRGE
jgi:hypothetical protein